SLRLGRSGILAALAAVALALTLSGLLTAVNALRSPPDLRAGVYYGWTDGDTGLFQVLGAACPDTPSGSDAVVAAYLTRGTALVEFRPPDVVDTAEALVFAEAVPVLSFAPRALATLIGGSDAGNPRALQDPSEASLSRLTVGCRSHAAASARLGDAAVALIPGTGSASDPAVTGIAVTARPVPPASDLLGVLVLSNDTDEPLIVHSLRY